MPMILFIFGGDFLLFYDFFEEFFFFPAMKLSLLINEKMEGKFKIKCSSSHGSSILF
jgi:hypothetical protein